MGICAAKIAVSYAGKPFGGIIPSHIRKIVLAHELGHAVLHAKITELRAFHDFELFDQTSVYEHKANVFAAEFLLDDADVLELLNEDISFFSAAKMLHVPPELLDYRFRILKLKCYALNPPLYAAGDFLKKPFLSNDTDF